MGSTLFDPKTGERVKQFFVNGRTIGRPLALAEPAYNNNNNNNNAGFFVTELPKDVWTLFTVSNDATTPLGPVPRGAERSEASAAGRHGTVLGCLDWRRRVDPFDAQLPR